MTSGRRKGLNHVCRSMEITREEIIKASEENSQRYVRTFQAVAESAFWEGAEWVLNLIDKKMKEI